MKRIFLLCGLITASCCYCHGQTSILQDGKGQSAFKMEGNAVTVNTGDNSLTSSFSVFSNKNDIDSWSLNINLGATNGLSSIKTSDGFMFAGSIGAGHIWHYSKGLLGNQVPSAHDFYVNGSFLTERDQLYDLTRTTNQVYDKGFPGWQIAGGESGYTKKDWLWGYGAVLGQSSNAKDIKQSTITSILPGGTDSIKLEKQQSAYASSIFRGTQFNAQINGDIAYPINAKKAANAATTNIYVAFHFRSKFYEISKPELNPAFGLYIAAPGNPKSVTGGLNLQETDLLNVLKTSNTSIGKRIGLSFTAGYGF